MAHKLRKNGFTLIEIIIVLLIIGIMMTAFKSIFQTKDQNTLYAQNCINMVYGEINNFLNAAMTSKGLYTGNTTVNPDRYIINFEESTSSIDFKYENEAQIGSQKIYVFSGGVPQHFNCYSEQYVVQMSGNNSRNIYINKSFSNQGDEIPFQIKRNTNTLLTGDIMFYACSKDKSHCQEIAKLSIDSRSKHISKSLCITYVDDNTQCLYRDK